jgi:hypothetical protein
MPPSMLALSIYFHETPAIGCFAWLKRMKGKIPANIIMGTMVENQEKNVFFAWMQMVVILNKERKEIDSFTSRWFMAAEIEREILQILEEAIRREQSAYKLYSRGRELSEKPGLKKIFAMLAEEEIGHEKLLRQVYYDYKKKLGLKVLNPDEGQKDGQEGEAK